MTTVAYKDGVLAADSLFTQQDTVCKMNCPKLYRLTGERNGWIGFSGIAADWLDFLDCLDGNETIDPRLLTVEAIFMPDEGCLQVIDVSSAGIIRFIDQPGEWALGSGRDLALGAMAAGATAQEAVKIAIDRDVGSGGKIVSKKKGDLK